MTASASAVTVELPAACRRQHGPPEFGATYMAVLAGPDTPFEKSGSLKPIALDSDLSETTVPSETVKRRMSSDMSGLLCDKTDGPGGQHLLTSRRAS